jgi:hypothetical protein
MIRYFFVVRDLHPLFLAGLSGAPQVKEEPAAARPAAGDTEQNTPARPGALAQTL